jgi:hypothetical protein
MRPKSDPALNSLARLAAFQDNMFPTRDSNKKFDDVGSGRLEEQEREAAGSQPPDDQWAW